MRVVKPGLAASLYLTTQLSVEKCFVQASVRDLELEISRKVKFSQLSKKAARPAFDKVIPPSKDNFVICLQLYEIYKFKINCDTQFSTDPCNVATPLIE